jgi:lysophospholipase L1-like esterase
MVAEGDSFTVSFGSSFGLTYPNQVSSYFPGKLEVINLATNGNRINPDMKSAAQTAEVDAQYRSGAVLLMFGGGNDIYFGATAAATYAELVAYCQARQAVGYKVIVFSYLPRETEIVSPPNSVYTERIALNALVRANWRTFADGYVDFEADTRIGVPGAWANPTYWMADGTHPINAGYAVIASYVAPVLRNLLPSPRLRRRRGFGSYGPQNGSPIPSPSSGSTPLRPTSASSRSGKRASNASPSATATKAGPRGTPAAASTSSGRTCRPRCRPRSRACRGRMSPAATRTPTPWGG